MFRCRFVFVNCIHMTEFLSVIQLWQYTDNVLVDGKT